MHYHDPSRPTAGIGQRPAYLTRDGKPIGPLQPLEVSPTMTPGFWKVGFWVMVGPVNGRRLELVASLGELPILLEAWVQDPEGILYEKFGYDDSWLKASPKPAPPAPRPKLDSKALLAKLGLLKETPR